MVIHVEQLGVSFGKKKVLDSVTADFLKGVNVIVGPNGSGKSTLLKAIATVGQVSSGEVYLNEAPVLAKPRILREELGYLPQHATFPGRFSVLEAIEYAAWLQNIPVRSRKAAVDRALDRTQLSVEQHKKIRALSGGMRQRLFLAQAIVHDPAVLLLDEPTIGVDVENRVAFRRMLKEVALSSVVVMTTHLSEDVEFLADRIFALSDGKLVWSGDYNEFNSLPGASVDGSIIENILSSLSIHEFEVDS